MLPSQVLSGNSKDHLDFERAAASLQIADTAHDQNIANFHGKSHLGGSFILGRVILQTQRLVIL